MRRTIQLQRDARGRSTEEHGSALVLAIFVLVLLTGLGTTLLFLSQNELKMSQANLRTKKAFYMAEAGIEDGRRTLYDANGSGATVNFTDDLQDAAADGTIDFDPAALEVSYDSDGNPTGFTNYGDDVPLRPITTFGPSSAPGWYAAFLTNDPVEGYANTIDLNDRVMITGIGAGSKRSMEIVQAIIEPFSILPTLPPAAITLLGPNPSFDPGTSAAQVYYSEDCTGSGVPGLYVPVVGTVGSSAEGLAENGASANGYNVTDCGASCDATNQTTTVVDLLDGFDPLLASSGLGALDMAWDDCPTLHDVVENLRAIADYICYEGETCTIPSTTETTIVFYEGDGTLNVGHGLVVCTGQLTINGSDSFDGVLMAVGEGRLLRDGSGNGIISGTTIVADVAGPDDQYGNADDCTGGVAGDGFGPADFQTNGGGDSSISYCSEAVAPLSGPQTYKVVEFLQR